MFPGVGYGVARLRAVIRVRLRLLDRLAAGEAQIGAPMQPALILPLEAERIEDDARHDLPRPDDPIEQPRIGGQVRGNNGVDDGVARLDDRAEPVFREVGGRSSSTIRPTMWSPTISAGWTALC